MQILTKYGSINNAAIGDAIFSPKDAVMFFDDYEQTIPSLTRNTISIGTGTTATVGTLDTGVAVVAQGSTASVNAIVGHTSATVGCTANREIWFEALCSCNYAVLANSGSAFIGFTSAAVGSAAVTAAGQGAASVNAIGFSFAEDGCLKTVVSNLGTAATQVNVFGGATLHAQGTDGRTFRLAMKISKNQFVTFYVNGVERATVTAALDTTTLNRLSMQVVGGTGTTTLKTMRVDYVSYAFNRT